MPRCRWTGNAADVLLRVWIPLWWTWPMRMTFSKTLHLSFLVRASLRRERNETKNFGASIRLQDARPIPEGHRDLLSFFEEAVPSRTPIVGTATSTAGDGLDSTDTTHIETRAQRSRPFPQRHNKAPRSQEDSDSYSCTRQRPFNCISFSCTNKVFDKPYAISDSACSLTNGDNTNGSKSRNDLQHDSRETCLIPKELGMYLKWPLGHKLHLGLCNRLCTDTIPTAPSKGVDLPPWGGAEPGLRGPENVRQACNSIDSQQSSQQGLPLPTVHCPKERWGYTSHYKPEKTKFICTDSPFQNGRYIYAERPPKNRRLDDQSGPEGRLLHGTHRMLHHRRLLRFKWQGQTFQFNCLPFGLSSAPWVFTKTTRPVIATLRTLGLRIIIYIDDILIMAETPTLAREHTAGLIFLLENLGFIINFPKSVLTPTQDLEFLGFTIDSSKLEIRLPGEKIKKVKQEAKKLLNLTEPQALDLSRLLGKLNHASQAIPPAPLFYRNLQQCLLQALRSGGEEYSATVNLTQDAQGELEWWLNHLNRWNGRFLLSREPDLTIETDASTTGWGALCQDVRTGGPWSKTERQMHINCLELLAATLAVKCFAKDKRNIRIHLRMDNTTALNYINKLGGTVSPELNRLTKDLWTWCWRGKSPYMPHT